MHSARISVGTQLILGILLAIVLSWTLSTGLANYFVYLNVKAVHRQMLARPDLYPGPIPEPRFGIIDFIIGPRRPFAPPPDRRPPDMRPPMQGPPPRPGPMGPPPGGPRGPQPPRMGPRAENMLLIRASIALLLALVMGTWLHRRFTRPLAVLTEGARAFHRGNFKHRIPADGGDEFASVATAMNDMAERVSNQIRALEEDAKRRRQFVADLAHELRSPVTTLKTMAGALDEGLANDPERQKHALAAVSRASDRLSRLVTDMMQLAKLDLKQLPLNLRETDLRDLARVVAQSHMERAVEAGITLHEPEPGRPVTASIDPDRIAQVLDNLIENAIDYAGEGAEVRVTLHDGDPLLLTVSDTGRGIPEKHLPYIFDSFYRVDAARTPGEPHSGLGLRIARGLTEAHGGQLTLTSTPGQGAKVTICLPR